MTLADAYPNYLERRQHVPLVLWHAGRATVLAAAFALIALLFVEPRLGLIAWWLYVLPCLPLLLMLAPGLWRNICPMAALNQVPRLFGFTRNLTVPRRLAQSALLIQSVFYFALISTRAPVFDHNGPAVGVLMLVALGAAFAGGVVFKGKSGWCGTFCPLMPVQRLYGQTPFVVVPNSHCSTCIGCTTNCLDFNPRLAVIADVHDGDEYRVGQLKLFAGTFPGFVLAFFTVPTSVIGAPADLGIATARYYLLTVVYMLVSLGVFFLLDALVPLSPLVLMAAFGALALNLHNWLRFTTSFHVAKPFWLRVIEELAVATITVWFVVRTYVHERRVGALERAERAAVAVPEAHVVEGSHEVRFAPDGPRIVVANGATLLEAAERAELPIEVGCRMGVCGADPIAIVDGAARLLPPSAGERSTLERLGLGSGCRMACSARVLGDVTVSLDLESVPTRAAARIELDYDRTVEHVVVIGNGIAGNTAADHARRRHPECTIDVIGAELHPAYNRMGISRLVYGRSAMAGLRLLGDDWYDRNRITPWLNTIVAEIDREARVVVLGTGERLPYDRIVIATGSRATLPPIEGVDDEAVFVMRAADDAIGIRAYAQQRQARRAVVVGGGLLGLEAAYALHRFGLRTTVVQRTERLLSGRVDERGAALLERYFLALGLNVSLGIAPVAVRDGVVLEDGSVIPADLVVVCAGVRPSTRLAEACGLDVAHGVVVDEHMRTSDPEIFAAGDVAEFGGVTHGLWPIAVAQAEIAAANAVGDERVYEPQPVVTILKGVGLSVQSAGEVDGADSDETIAFEPSGDDVRYWKLTVSDGVLVGAVLIGEWREAGAVLDGVAEGRDVRRLVATLRQGDLSALGLAEEGRHPAGPPRVIRSG